MTKIPNDITESTEFQKLRKAEFLRLRDMWIDYVNQCERLSHATSRVGIFIALRMDAKKQYSYWPVKKIAKMIPRAPGKKMSTKTISVAIAELVREGVLLVHRPNRRANQSYSIRLPLGCDVVNTSLSDVVNTS